MWAGACELSSDERGIIAESGGEVERHFWRWLPGIGAAIAVDERPRACWGLGAYASLPTSPIPVLVITSAPRSLRAGEFLSCHRVIHGADAPWLDSCDRHRNGGGKVDRSTLGNVSIDDQ